jgi:hypothetical protein
MKPCQIPPFPLVYIHANLDAHEDERQADKETDNETT